MNPSAPLTPHAFRIKRARRHPLLSLCSRQDGFPPGVARGLIEEFTRPGDAALDPFCGSPAAIAQAAWSGRETLALAPDLPGFLAARAALDPPDRKAVAKRLRELGNDMFFGDPSRAPKEIQHAFDGFTLSQLTYLREQVDAQTPVDGFIAATIVGWLEQSAGTRRGKTPPKTDVFAVLSARLDALFRRRLRAGKAQVWLWRDGRRLREVKSTLRRADIPLVLGAPPPIPAPRAMHEPRAPQRNLGAWFLGTDERQTPREGAVPRDVPGYVAWLEEACGAIRPVMSDGGALVLLLRDAVLPGRPRRLVPVAHRLWKRLEERNEPFDLISILDLSGRLMGADANDAEPSFSIPSRPVARLLMLKAT